MEIDLIKASRNRLQDHYPQGITYQIHQEVDGKPTIRKAA